MNELLGKAVVVPHEGLENAMSAEGVKKPDQGPISVSMKSLSCLRCGIELEHAQ